MMGNHECVAILRPAEEGWDDEILRGEEKDRLAPALGMEAIDFGHPAPVRDTPPWVLTWIVHHLDTRPISNKDGTVPGGVEAFAFDRKAFEERLEHNLARIGEESGARTAVERLDAILAVERERGIRCALAEGGAIAATARSLFALLLQARDRLDGRTLLMTVLPARIR